MSNPRKIKSKRLNRKDSKRRVRRGFKLGDAFRDAMRAARRLHGLGISK